MDDVVTVSRPNDADYQRLLEFRTGLRRFLRWSEDQARLQGVTPAQHQLLLAVRGHPDPAGPSIKEIAGYLALRHHSAVGLIDRAAAAGLVARVPDDEHHGTVHITLTDAGRSCLEALAELHMSELVRLAPTMEALWKSLREQEAAGG